MKIYNFENDYAQSNKFKMESVNNVANQTKDDRQKSSEQISTETQEPEALAEAKESQTNRKKKQTD